MPHYAARLIITLKNGVLDPQGQASTNALKGMGFGTIQSVRQGKVMDVELDAANEAAARTDLTAMCEKLLANTVIENFEIETVAEKEPAEA